MATFLPLLIKDLSQNELIFGVNSLPDPVHYNK